MENSLRIDQWGSIQSGSNKGWYVRINDDSKGETGGYYIFIQRGPKETEGYDMWVETWQEVEKHFVEENWIIDWSKDYNLTFLF